MFRSLVFWGALPFVGLQALRVRRLALRLQPADGPSSGSVGSGPSLRLLAIGDSIIVGVGASTLDKALIGRTAESLAGSSGRTVDWQAIGQSGIRSGGVLDELLPSLPEDRVDVFLISVGVNDVTSLTRTSVWATNLDRLLCALGRHSPAAVIAFAGIPPLRDFPLLPQPLRSVIGFRGETLDRVAQRLIAAHPRALHVPVDFKTHADSFCSDGFHPSEAGYIEFGRAMADQLVARLSDRTEGL